MTATPDFPEGGAALVVGGSGGIGQAVCVRLAQAGSDVALTYNRNAAGGDATAALVRDAGRRAEVLQLSLDEAGPVAACLDEAADRLGPLHSVIYAAGPGIGQPFISGVSPSAWRDAVDADLNGFFNLVHAAIPHLRRIKGALVAVSSAGIRRYPPGDILSVAPKAAVEALVRGVAREEGRYGVRANSVALGVIEAGMFLRLARSELSPDWLDAALRHIALRRFGLAEEAAEAVVFLASRRAGYITGQTLVVDGGYSV